MQFFGSYDLEQQLVRASMNTALIGALVLVAGTVLAMLFKKQKKLKLPIFLLMAVSIVIPSVILVYNTIYLNTHSESGGPVHWHTDVEFWACGSELELRDPIGALSNKIGSSTYHEHNDKRIHLEGVVVKKQRDASFGKFLELTTGQITHDSLKLPLNQDSSTWLVSGDSIDGDRQNTGFDSQTFVKSGSGGVYAVMINGQHCSGNPAELQAFVYSYNKENKTYTQRKLEDPSSYVMRDESVVPPGDCLIVEFDVVKSRTDKLCRQYGTRDGERCVQFGVKEYNSEICNIREVQ